MAQPDLTIYRVAAGIWLPVIVLAALWAEGGDGLAMRAYWLTAPFALATAMLTPQRLYRSAHRHWLVCLYTLGLATTLAAIYHDSKMSFGPDYVAMGLRGTQAVIFAALIKYAVMQRHASHAA
jgi:hypothetical protein